MPGPPPKLLSVACEVPEHRIRQAEAAEIARRVFQGVPGIERLLRVFKTSLIDSRYFCVPPGWFLDKASAERRNDVYIEEATKLSARALSRALERAGVAVEDVDYLVFVSTTGLATPSIDARLINRLGFRSDVRHSPVWGRGCAGGTYALAHAADYLRGQSDGIAAIVTAEFCGLTFLPEDQTPSNVVASALFGDGVAAAVLAGGDVARPGSPIVASRSCFFEDSLDVMGWNIGSSGLQVVFQRRIPGLVRRHGKRVIGDLLAQAGVGWEDVGAYVLHPGGRKVLEAYRDALDLDAEALEPSRAVLAEFGNMSSSTVLFVLERFLSRPEADRRGYAVASALGPGFCAESVLLDARPA